MDSKPVHIIKSSKFISYFFGIVFLAVIIICLVNININPPFFSIISGIFFLFIILLSNRTITIYNDRFEIVNKRLIKLFNSRAVYKYDDIIHVDFEEGYRNPHNAIYNVPSANKADSFIIKFKNQDEDEKKSIMGTKKQMKEIITLINKLIKEYNINYARNRF